MKRFVEGTDRKQSTLFPECLEDWIDENNSVQVIDVSLGRGRCRARSQIRGGTGCAGATVHRELITALAAITDCPRFTPTARSSPATA
jgi:hypothetical protein